MSRNDDMQFYTEIKLVVMNFRTLYNGFIVIGNTVYIEWRSKLINFVP